MIKVEEKDDVIVKFPDLNHIPCLRCKWGQMNYLDISCAKYPNCKPNSVYYESADCEKFEEVKK